MNKDVIYIEPEDDITDIIAKIEKSKEKIVALVPPKKAGVFRSIVNIKLISKAGASADKSVVLVTVDPSIVKLAAATKLPVSKNLQSAPEIPKAETTESLAEQTIEDVSDPEEEAKETEETETEEKSDKATKSKDSDGKDKDGDKDDKKTEDEEDEDDDEEEKPKSSKKDKKKSTKQSGNKFTNWIKAHKKLAIVCGVFLVGLIAFLIWAFGFAPAVDIQVAIKTDSKNFSEAISFVDSLDKENAKEGKFYLEQKKIDNTQEVNFEATGQKNVGQKASGDVTFQHTFWTSGAYSIDSVTVNGLTFIANTTSSISWSGEKISQCDNIKGITDVDEANAEFRSHGCEMSVRVGVTAAEAGTKYNIPKSCGWLSLSGATGCSEGAMTGGTDDIKTVVQQSDIEKAKGELTTAKEDENKKKLYESIGDEYYILESSFEQSTSNAEATPAVDQEVSGDKKPVLKATTTATVYVVNKDKLKEFIREKADLEDNQKVYDIKNIYIENFTNNGANSTAKLKAQYYIGPKITETEVVEKVKGKGLGDAQREIRDIYGVSDVRIDTSYPWVMAVPNDSNKVKVSFEVKDQDGNAIKEQSEDEKTDGDQKDEKDSKDNKSDNKSEEKKNS